MGDMKQYGNCDMRVAERLRILTAGLACLATNMKAISKRILPASWRQRNIKRNVVAAKAPDVSMNNALSKRGVWPGAHVKY